MTALGCAGAPVVLQYSALIKGVTSTTSTVDTVANMSEHAMQAEEKVISYET